VTASDAYFDRATVNLSPGTYQSGAIRLKDNTTLHLEAGAVLTPTHVAEDYPRPGRALVYSDGAKNIVITGRGAIDGQARHKWGPDAQPDPIIPEEKVRAWLTHPVGPWFWTTATVCTYAGSTSNRISRRHSTPTASISSHRETWSSPTPSSSAPTTPSASRPKAARWRTWP
jgi:hypothetical protein